MVPASQCERRQESRYPGVEVRSEFLDAGRPRMRAISSKRKRLSEIWMAFESFRYQTYRMYTSGRCG
jgi:hypothetical protein